MTDFNCDCESTSTYETLLQLRTRMMVRLGFAVQAATPPPGMATLLDDFLRSTQKTLYRKNPVLRTERFYRWTLLQGERFYGIRDEDPLPDTDQLTATGGTIVFTAAQLLVGTTPAGISQFDLDGKGLGGVLTSGDLAGYNYFQIYWLNASGGELHVALRIPTTDVRASPQTSFFTNLNIVGCTNGVRTAASATFTTAVQGDDTIYTWVWPSSALSGPITKNIAYTALFTPVSTQAYCGKSLNEYEIHGVWLEDLQGTWTPLAAGINPTYYTMAGQLGYPSCYDVRSCIEVFPAPQVDGLKLWIKGQFELDAFIADGDRTTIDSELVFLWALAAAKAHYNKADARDVKAEAVAYLLDLKAGKHLTHRYIPGYQMLPPETRPVLLPLS